MRRLYPAVLAILASFSLCASANAVELSHKDPLVPLYESYSDLWKDHFYTTSVEEHDIAVNQLGYVDGGIAAYLERREQPRTKEFNRFYKDAPEYNHFYTWDPAEIHLVSSQPPHGLGYTAEGPEGWIYEFQVPGSVALHRLNLWDPSSSNQMHKYTTSEQETFYLQSTGWTYDGVAGYVYREATPAIPGGTVVGLRCPPEVPATNGRCWESQNEFPNFRDYFFASTLQPSTLKPSGTTTQVTTFYFETPDFFRAGGIDHIAFGMHGRMNVHMPDVELFCPLPGTPGGTAASNCTWQRALGIVLYQDTSSRAGLEGKQFGAEAWWVPDPEFAPEGTAVRPPQIDPSQIAPLQNDTRYQVNITVTDNGSLTATIRAPNQQVVGSATWNTTQDPVYLSPNSPFPNELTGYFIAPAGEAKDEYTFFITDLQVVWQ